MPRFFRARTILWLWLPFLLLAASCGAAVGAVRLVRADGDRVKILGSGNDVSILITTGRTELLIATGTDRTAFGNAYDSVAIAPGSRPDIMLLAGSGQLLNVPTSVIDLYPNAKTYSIHPLRAGPTADSGLESVATLPRNPIRFTLDGRITVIVESLLIDADASAFAWRALITRENSQVAIVSAAKHAELFTWVDPVSALIVAADVSDPNDLPVDAAAIIGSAETLDPPHGATGTAITDQSPAHVFPVRPGSVATLTFVQSGVELTSDDRVYSTNLSV